MNPGPEPDIVGRGWAFPGALEGSGGFRMVSGATGLDGSLQMILRTRPGERVMRPEFGCDLWELVFAPLTATTFGRIEQVVREAVERWEPRVDLDDVRAATVPGQDARVDVVLTYRVRSTNDPRTLVFPFYVLPGEDGTGTAQPGGRLSEGGLA